MIINLYSIFDSKSELWSEILMAHNSADAERKFSKGALTPGHDFNLFPGDYTLFHVGSFNTQTGEALSYPSPHSIINGAAAKAKAGATSEEN